MTTAVVGLAILGLAMPLGPPAAATSSPSLEITVPVSYYVRNAVISPNGRYLYTVGTLGTAHLVAFDTQTNTVAWTTLLANGPTVGDPVNLAVTPDGTRVYVGVAGGLVSVVDTSTHALIGNIDLRAASGEPSLQPGYDTVASPDGKFIYQLTNWAPNGYVVAIIDADPASGTYNTVVEWMPTTGDYPMALTFTPNGGSSFYIMSASGYFRIYDSSTRAQIGGPFGTPMWYPSAMAFSPDGQTLYAATKNYAHVPLDALNVFDVATQKLIATVPVEDDPRGVAVSPDGTRVYVSNSYQDNPSPNTDGTVSVIAHNAAAPGEDAVISTVVVGAGPWGLAMNAAGTRLYTPNWDGRSVSVVGIVPATPTPTITSQPQAATKAASSTATFTVGATVTGSGSLTYQWQVSTNSGGTWSNVSSGTGATTASYTTAALTGPDGGNQYRVQVTNTVGALPPNTLASDTALLTVTTPSASITTQPTNATRAADQTASFTVAATSAAGARTFQWQSSPDGSVWSNVSTGSGGTTATYTTAPLAAADNGRYYRAVVTNTVVPLVDAKTSNSNSATVTVTTPLPVFGAQPQDASKYVEEVATFSASATASSGTLSYQWFSSTNQGSTWIPITGADQASYTTPVLTSDDNGTRYRVTVTNTLNPLASVTATSSAAILTVNKGPSNVALPEAPGRPVAVAGDRSASVTWPLPGFDGGGAVGLFTVTASPGNRTCTTTGALTCVVTGLANGVQYTFAVTATNDAGMGPASPPSNPVIPAGRDSNLGPQPIVAQQPTGALPPGGSLLLVDGKPGPVTVAPNAPRNPTGLDISGDDFTMKLAGLGDNSDPLELTDQQALVLQSRQADASPATRSSVLAKDVCGTAQPLAVTSGTGFMPNQRVKFYLLPAISLGEVTTDAAGNFSGSVPVPAGVQPGPRTLQVNALARNGAVLSLSLGVEVRRGSAVQTSRARDQVFFAPLSAVITPAGKKALNRLVRTVEGSSVRANIVGFMQDRERSAKDRSLSADRARSVAAYLRSAGLPGAYAVRGSGVASDRRTARRVNVAITYLSGCAVR